MLCLLLNGTMVIAMRQPLSRPNDWLGQDTLEIYDLKFVYEVYDLTPCTSIGLELTAFSMYNVSTNCIFHLVPI